MLTIKNYQVTEQIYESSNSAVYRGVREADKQPVILKLLQGEYPTLQQVTNYRQEYEITRSVEAAGVVKVYELLPYRNSLVMVLEDFGGQSLKSLGLAGTLSLEAFLALAIQLSDILGQVHQAQIMHKDINPANVVYNPMTQKMKLIDFGISTRLSREYAMFHNPAGLEGTLAYISPEQTGRMNRAIDYRTDLYSLGVTLYELLTGKLPFEEKELLALVHAHMARQPLAPVEQLRIKNYELGIDTTSLLLTPYSLISDIIMKLLAKNAEDRYQSAFGLKYDLERMMSDELRVMSEKQQSPDNSSFITHHSSFPLGQRDFSGRFQIPQKLYGREQEIATLLTGFEQVAGGEVETGHALSLWSELVLVTGYSGIGKSALVQEVYKPLTAKKGYFIGGKFDQYQRNIPYSAWLQAFQNLMRQLLTETEVQIATWKEKLLTALAPNGQIMVEIIPEVALIIGSQPAVPELGPIENQNRFNMVLQNFIRVFLQAEHPLVLFLDDLQWADEASLKLLELLLTSKEVQYLYLIGAYRDNEVGAGHPLLLTLKEIAEKGGVIHTIGLAALDFAQVNELVADTLQQSLEQTADLAALVHEKTGGNPFFVTEFLKSLYTLNLIRFEASQGVWQWDLSQIQAQRMTNNVVELMSQKIELLPAPTQTVLKWAACMGNEFDLATLAVIYEQPPSQTAQDLWAAIMAGLVLLVSDNYNLLEQELTGSLNTHYKFAHDRIQQASYLLIPEAERAALHLKIGRILWSNVTALDLADNLFNIVDQFNRGHDLIETEAERLQLANLNLQAGQRAKQSTAYQSAISYFSLARQLLPEQAWESHYSLVFALYREEGEAESLAGHFEASDILLDEALAKAQSKFDKVAVYLIKLAQLSMQVRYRDAVATAIEALNMLGLEVPTLAETAKQQQATIAELALYEANMAGRTIESLYDLPLLEDETIKVCTDIIGLSLDSINLGIPELMEFYPTKMVNLAIQYGLSDYTPVGFCHFGSMKTATDYQVGYKFSLLAIKLLEEKLSNPQIRAKVYMVHGIACFIEEPFSAILSYQKQAYRVGLEIGDLVFASYVVHIIPVHLFAVNLAEGFAEVDKALLFLQQINNMPFYSLVQVVAGLYKNMQGLTFSPDSLSSADFSEAEFLQIFGAIPVFRMYYECYKLFQLTLWGLDDQAWPLAKESAAIVGVVGAVIFMKRDAYFFSGLVSARYYDHVTEEVQVECLTILEQSLRELKRLVEEGREANFHGAYLLLAAEKARIENNPLAAMKLYNQAIQNTKELGFFRDEAIINERAAQFYFTQGLERVALDYLREARYLYERWGATAKVKDLEAQYPELRAQGGGTSPLMTSSRPHSSSKHSNTASQMLDLASVMKAAQAISSEINLNNLLDKLMQIVRENAGAQRGLLVLWERGAWFLQAELENDQVTVMQRVPIEQISGQSDTPKLSGAMLRYVERTQQELVLANASAEGVFTHTDYVLKRQPKSILCIPLVNQGLVMGFIYLENNLATNVFTPERVEIVRLLGTQATISIRNAQAIAVRAERERLQLENELLGKLNADKDKFFSIVAHDLKGPFMPLLGNAELLAEMGDTLKPAEVKEMGVSIQRSAKNTFALLENLLHWARLQMGRMEYQPEPLDLHEVAQQTVEVLGEVAEAKGICLVNDVARGRMVYGDAHMLDTVIRNLVNNALKFTPSGGQVTISSNELRVKSDELKSTQNSSLITHHYVTVSITDTGVGMGEEVRQKLFKLDQHVTTMGTAKEQGTGLGLIICQEVIQKSGGRIWVESQVGQGTTVHFTVLMDKV